MATRVVNIKSNLPYDTYIGRAGRGLSGYFGNPFRLEPRQLRGATLAQYESYFLHRVNNDLTFRNEVLKLKDKTLACFCKPHPCHGDIIAKWLDNQ